VVHGVVLPGPILSRDARFKPASPNLSLLCKYSILKADHAISTDFSWKPHTLGKTNSAGKIKQAIAMYNAIQKDSELLNVLDSNGCLNLFLGEANEGIFEDMVNNFKVAWTSQQSPDIVIKLCKKRKESAACKFVVKYTANFLRTMSFEYVDEAQERLNQERYYASVKITYDSLNSLLFNTYKHGDRRIGLWSQIDRQEDGSLTCAYSGAIIETRENQRLMKADEEHVVPQSWHRGSKLHPGTDMHQIFIVSKSANGSRGNKIFGNLGEEYIRQRKVGGLLYQNGGESRFCPHLNSGAICRATLYVLVTYKHTFHKQYFPPSALAWLVEQAASVPVSKWEKHRNQELFLLQRNRNPFIDHPEWARQIDFSNAFA
jgi:endonuclease I